MKHPGWKALEDAYRAKTKDAEPKKEGAEKALPELTEGQTLSVAAAIIKEGKSSPPQRFTEDTLLSAMETLAERETILLYNQAEPMAEIYTHDPRLMEKLDLLAKKHPDQITRKDAHNFTVPKRCVSVREPYSAERRKAASERAKAAGYQPPMRKSGS